MPAPLQIDIKQGEHVSIFGMTGSGKTTLAEQLLRGVDRLVVFDPKGLITDWGLVPYDRESIKLLENDDPVRIRVPAPEPGENAERYYATALETAYRAADCFIYVDEVYLLTDEGKGIARWLKTILTQGRAFGVSGVMVSQRPVWIPRFVVSESLHTFLFTLNLQDDRDRVTDVIGSEARHHATGKPMSTQERPPDKHGFFYHKIGGREAVYVPRLPRAGKSNRGAPVDIDVMEDDDE